MNRLKMERMRIGMAVIGLAFAALAFRPAEAQQGLCLAVDFGGAGTSQSVFPLTFFCFHRLLASESFSTRLTNYLQ